MKLYTTETFQKRGIIYAYSYILKRMWILNVTFDIVHTWLVF